MWKKEINQTKVKCIRNEDEENANLMLSCECFVDALILELEMWVQLKKDEPNTAWNSLVTAQNMIGLHLRLDRICHSCQLVCYRCRSIFYNEYFKPDPAES